MLGPYVASEQISPSQFNQQPLYHTIRCTYSGGMMLQSACEYSPLARMCARTVYLAQLMAAKWQEEQRSVYKNLNLSTLGLSPTRLLN